MGPAIIQPPMDFELEPWPTLPDGVIANDTTTQSQDRARAPALSSTAMEGRRQQLADRFGCEVPNPAFFQEICASGDYTGPAVVLARSHQYKKAAQCRYEELEATGREFTVWPVHGRWRFPPTDPQVLQRHSAMTARLATRHHNLSHLSLALHRRSIQALAQQLLRQCYKQAPALEEPAQGLARRLLDTCYMQQCRQQGCVGIKGPEGLRAGAAKMSRSSTTVPSALNAAVFGVSKRSDVEAVETFNVSF